MQVRDGGDAEEERTVDAQAGVTDDLLDLAVSLKIVESLAGKAAVDLKTIDKGGDSDQTVGLDILLKLVVGGLVENDGVLGLVLDCRAKDMLVKCCFSVFDFVSPARPTISFVSCGNSAEIVTIAWLVVIAYPCPWTTSSFASCLRLLRAPVRHISISIGVFRLYIGMLGNSPFCRMRWMFKGRGRRPEAAQVRKGSGA